MNRERPKISKQIFSFVLVLIILIFFDFLMIKMVNLIFGVTLGFEMFVLALFLPVQYALSNFFLEKKEYEYLREKGDEKLLEVRYDEHGNHDPNGLYNETDIYQLVHTERMFEELEK